MSKSRSSHVDKIMNLTADEAFELLRVGIPVSELQTYRKTRVGACESFWDHIRFLEDFGILELRDGRLVQTS